MADCRLLRLGFPFSMAHMDNPSFYMSFSDFFPFTICAKFAISRRGVPETWIRLLYRYGDHTLQNSIVSVMAVSKQYYSERTKSEFLRSDRTRAG